MTVAQSLLEKTKQALEQAKRIDQHYHYFNTFCDDLALQQTGKPGILADVFVTIKDNICVKNVETTAGSAILRGYKPPFHATAVERLLQAGAIPLGKTAMDEFGFGSYNTNVGKGFRVPKHPSSPEYVTGGSSGGAAGIAAKATFPHVALCESTGGSIVAPASFCGVIGYCPTYGRVSRYGLLDYASSLDKIGVIGKDLILMAKTMNIIAGHDPHDSTSSTRPVQNYPAAIGATIKGVNIGYIPAFFDGADPEVARECRHALKQLEAKGATLQAIDLPLTQQHSLSAYYLLAMSEASTNLAKYCGIRYGGTDKLEGYFDQFFTHIRTGLLGDEAKRRIILGTFARMAGYRDAYYLQAAKVRTKIIEEYKRAFADVDVIATPTMPFPAPKLADVNKLSPLQNYLADVNTVGPNLAGLPHMTVPVGSAKMMPVGLMLTSSWFDETILFTLASHVEAR